MGIRPVYEKLLIVNGISKTWPRQNVPFLSHINARRPKYVQDVFFFTGSNPKSSKYGTGFCPTVKSKHYKSLQCHEEREHLTYSLGWFLFWIFSLFDLDIPTSCSVLFTDFKTVFVFDVRPFLPFAIKIFGFNRNFNGKMTKINKMAKNRFSGSKMIPKVSKRGF